MIRLTVDLRDQEARALREMCQQRRSSAASQVLHGGKYFKRPALLRAEVTFFRQLRR